MKLFSNSHRGNINTETCKCNAMQKGKNSITCTKFKTFIIFVKMKNCVCLVKSCLYSTISYNLGYNIHATS